VAGGGSGLARWKSEVANSGLQYRARFLGSTDRIPEVLAAADLLVSPVRYEAYGLNVQEAICRGVPAMVSRDAGMPNAIPTTWRLCFFPIPTTWKTSFTGSSHGTPTVPTGSSNSSRLALSSEITVGPTWPAGIISLIETERTRLDEIVPKHLITDSQGWRHSVSARSGPSIG